jgi:hypothetical protein
MLFSLPDGKLSLSAFMTITHFNLLRIGHDHRPRAFGALGTTISFEDIAMSSEIDEGDTGIYVEISDSIVATGNSIEWAKFRTKGSFQPAKTMINR